MNIQQPARPHAEREYLHTFTAGALLPFMRATLMGLVVFIVTWIIFRFVFDAMDAYKWGIIPGAVTWVWNLFREFRHWINLTTIETVLQKDINGDGVIGKATAPSAPSEARKIRIELSTVKDGQYSSNTIDFPCDDEQLDVLAKGLINGLPFSERPWTGEGKPFSTNEFRAVKDVMKKHDLVEYVSEADPRQGMRLTAKGRALMEKIALPSPAPHSDLSDSPA